MPTVSLCMIVKNEEDNLRKSLAAIEPYVDEIIVVDTGSTDNSKEVAAEFRAKVYDFEWINDFSAARNYSLRLATCQWILVLDADEVFIGDEGHSQLAKHIHNAGNKVGKIRQENHFMQDGEERVNYTWISRLFPNYKGYGYQGRIHEQLVLNGEAPEGVFNEMAVFHLGYSSEATDLGAKLERNLRLLTEALHETPEDAYLLYQLAKTYSVAKDYYKAVEYYDQALATVEGAPRFLPDLVLGFGYALKEIGQASVGINLITN